MKVDLNGQIALVTGAARGIGKAIADALAVNGARVIYADIDLETARQSASTFPGCCAVSMNVADETQVNAVVSDIASRHSRLDILVNNAGINTLKHRVTIDEFPREEWDKIIAVDLTGLYLVSKAASRQMLLQERPGGRIINIASVGGLVPLRLQCAFIAAKAGVVNLTRAMAIELGSRNVLTNCIAPGSILTDGTRKLFYGDDGMFKANVRQLMDHIPLGRPGLPEEVAHAALFLAAPESSYINGHVLTIDGGWTAGYARDF